MESGIPIEERVRAYEVCKQRGHSPSGIILASNPPWNVCEFCGVNYRWREPELIEANVPVAPSSSGDGS